MGAYTRPPTTPGYPRTMPVTLVTGAARRLGRHIALDLASAGHDLVIHHRDSLDEAEATAAACRALGARAICLHADLEDEAQTAALVPRTVEALGALHNLVNNASLFQHDDPSTFSYAAAERHHRTNAAAPVLLARELHRHLSGRDGQGAVVQLLDQKLWNPNPDFLSYTLSKAALEASVPTLAMALAPLVRVVGVAPGLTLTSHMLDDERFQALHRLSPLGRSSTPEDVAATVRFALTNRSLTGTTLLVDGGQHLLRFERDFSLM